MPASQLKRLKAAAHEQRIAKRKGPAGKPTDPPSKKPTPSKAKHAVSRASAQERAHALRAQQLLPEFRARNRVGGIIDRRIGEDDPTLAPEEKEARRYAAERQRTAKKRSVFNLEDVDDDEEVGQVTLTHGGQPLGANRPRSLHDMVDDFEASGSDDDDDAATRRDKKRKRLEEQVEEMMAQREHEPDRKRSKKEVMEEVIAKSKLHKYERQKQKEDDEDARDELDRALPDLLSLLRGNKKAPNSDDKPAADTPAAASGRSNVHPDRMQLMDKRTREQAEKEYDTSLRQLVMDKRAQPTERTKTDEEKAKDEAQRLRELEDRRQKRMRGEPISSDEEEEDADEDEADGEADPFAEPTPADEAAEFGLGSKLQPTDAEGEDDFVLDEDLIASGSDLEAYLSDEDDDSDKASDAAAADDDKEFLQDVLSEQRSQGVEQSAAKAGKPLAYTYKCPQSRDELAAVFQGVAADDMPTVVQRIRALYHPQLAAENKGKLAQFAAALVSYLEDLAAQRQPTRIVESIIRHVHSLSKAHGDAVAVAFREQLSLMSERGTIRAADLVVLTAIGTIYPTSDHFHQVVTPAMTIMAKWLGVTTPTTLPDSVHGAYLVALALRYQRQSKRVVPETLRFTRLALAHAATLADAALVTQHLANLSQAMDLWAEQPAFIDLLQPDVAKLLAPGSALQRAHPKPCHTLAQKLRIRLNQSQLRRRPLELHHHRPLPIKLNIPKFEDNFDPAAHYDADKERADEARLRKEYKREKKGAVRELRRDAEFMAREKLREKKEKDRLYEEKQRRILGEIEREDGREKNAYERERRKRSGRF